LNGHPRLPTQANNRLESTHPHLWRNRKGGLRPPLFDLYFYFTKPDGFTTPTLENYYLFRNEGLGPKSEAEGS